MTTPGPPPAAPDPSTEPPPSLAMSGGHRIAAAVRSNTIMFPLMGVAGFTANVAVARALAPAVFALYTAAIALRGSVQFLADLGTGQASSRLFAELQERGARQQAWRLFTRLAALRAALLVVLTLVIVAFPDTVSDLFNLRPDEQYFLTFIVLFAVAEVAAGLGYYLLIGTLDQRSVNTIQIAQGIVQPILVLAAAAAGVGLKGILAGVLAGSVLKAVGMNVVAIRRLRTFEQRSAGISGLRGTYSKVATSSIVGKLATWVHSRQILTIVALSAVSRPEVAVFALAYDLATQVIGYASSPANGVVLPAFAVNRSNEAATARLFALTTRGAALLVLPAATTLLVVSPVLIPTLFGAEYDDAIQYTYIFIPAMAAELILTLSAANLMVANDDLLAAFAKVKFAAVVLGLLYLAVIGSGLLLVAAVMMAVRVGSAIALHVAIRKRRSFALDVRWLLKAVAVAAAAGGIAVVPVLVLAEAAVELALAPILCLTAFAALTWMSRLVPAEDAGAASRLHPAAGRLVSILAR